MMSEKINEECMKYIISRLVANASDAKKESKANAKDVFLAGRKVAYYEMLDILQSELYAHDIDLKEMGIDIDLEQNFCKNSLKET